MSDNSQSAESILQRITRERKIKEGHYMDKRAPKFHLIHEASNYNGAVTIEGQCFVECANGTYRKANGEELRQIADAYPILIKNWRLPEE